MEYLTSGSAEVYLAGPLGPSGQCSLYKGGQRDLDPPPPPPHTAAVTESAVYLTMKWYTGNNVKKRRILHYVVELTCMTTFMFLFFF